MFSLVVVYLSFKYKLPVFAFLKDRQESGRDYQAEPRIMRPQAKD